jgi:hypothetical protein
VKTGARLIAEHGPAKSPVARAFLEYTGGKDRQSWDQTAALHAVRGLGPADRPYFRAVGPGYNFFEVAVAPRAPDRAHFSRNTWVPAPGATQAYLVEAMPPEELARVIEDLMMQPPARLAAPSAAR